MRLLAGLLCFIAAGLCVACSGLAQARAPAFVLGEPALVRYESNRVENVDLVVNIWSRTYDVPGATVTEVSQNLEALRRGGTGHGPFSASTKWDLQLGLRYADEPSGCRIANATVEIAAVITWPALEDGSQMSALMRGRWTEFISNLRAHELEHVANEVAGAGSLQSELIALQPLDTCRAVGDAANAFLRKHEQMINKADVRLDAETEHGALTGAMFP